MKYIAILLIIYAFLKTFFYGSYELKHQKNKWAGIGIYFLSLIGLIFPIVIIFIFY